jgi:hypothetical protein
LIGFQLVVVFSNRFAEALDGREQSLHLIAIGAAVVALSAYMAPAIYHREAEAGWISAGLINVSTKFLAIATPLLGASIALDFFLIARVVTHNAELAAGSSLTIILLIALFWFGVPRIKALRSFFRRN